MTHPPRDDELAARFSFHPATETTAPLHEAVRATCLFAAKNIRERTPPSREQSLAFTALQEAMMWANAAIAIHGAPA